jgi:hypothetical protein
MNEAIMNRVWIVTQVLRIRRLEAEVKRILATEKTPVADLARRVAELKFQLDLLDSAIN